jgi:hypothetical protein
VKFGIVEEHQVLTDELAYSQSSLHETETGLISLLKIVRPRIVDARKTRAVGLIKSRKRFCSKPFSLLCIFLEIPEQFLELSL